MPSPNMTDEQLAEHYGRRIPGGQPLFEPFEWGYRCPQGHRSELITWSEFNNHIWCHKCQLDYSSETCPMQRPSWMDPDEFGAFVSKLPFKPKILLGVARSIEPPHEGRKS